MRKAMLGIFASVAALAPAGAAPRSQIVRNAPDPLPDVRIHRPDSAGTSWNAPADADVSPRWDTRRYDREDDLGPDGFDGGYYDPAIPYYDGSTDEDFRHERADARYPERLERDEAGDLDYDRDYPYDYAYGAEGARARYGARGYVMTETITTTTTPTVTRRTYYDAPVSMYAPKRHRKLRRSK